MTSMETGASEHALINLIHRHLKDNGYKKAASALQQQVSQVQATNVKVSLEDIFKKWLSEEREKKTDEGKAPHSGSESTTNAAHNTKPEKKTLAAARQQKRKRSKTEMCISSIAVKDHKTGEDSDSDSSLDVEKWKRLALELSDADLAKMDAFINFSTSTGKSTKTQKPAQPKKQQSPKKTKVKTATSLTKTDKKKPTNKKNFSSSESDNIATPSNIAVLAEPNEKSPERKTTANLLDQVAMPRTAVSNGLSESDRTNFKHKKKHSLSKSHNMETTNTKADLENTEPPSKKTKSKKNLTPPGRFETPCKVTDAEFAIQPFQCGLDSVLHSKTGETKAKKDKSKKAKSVEPVGVDTLQTGTEDATGSLSSDQLKINQVFDFIPAETKKAKSKKSKKSKELQEPGDVAMPSGECENEVDHNHSNQHQTEALPVSVKKAVTEPEAVEKRSKKAKKSLIEPNGREKPTKNLEIQVATSILESLSSETPSKKSKTKKASEAHQVDSPSKQAVVDVGDGEAAKNSSSQSDQTVNSFKKSKRKRADHASCGDHETSPVTEHVPKGQYNSLIPAGHGTKPQDQECVLEINAEGTPEPKKRKKHKKDREKKNNESDENVEELQPTPPAEECTDSLASSQKKKKKKKQKHREEEVPFVSTPAPEEYVPKKKKNSSKKKEHVEVSEQELI